MLHDFIHSAIWKEQLYVLQQHIFNALNCDHTYVWDEGCVWLTYEEIKSWSVDKSYDLRVFLGTQSTLQKIKLKKTQKTLKSVFLVSCYTWGACIRTKAACNARSYIYEYIFHCCLCIYSDLCHPTYPIRGNCFPSSDDDMSEHSSGHETPASSSSRQDLDADDGKKKKKKDERKKKEKKTKGRKKSLDSVEDTEKKTKKKGFGILR